MNKYLASYILVEEYACRHCGKFPPDFDLNDPLVIYQLIFQNFKEIREEFGRPINITSGYRCLEHQLDLYKNGISSTPYSTHIYGCALDLAYKDEKDRDKLLDIIKQVNPELRIGHKKYYYQGNFHIHIDNAYLLTPRISTKWHGGASW